MLQDEPQNILRISVIFYGLTLGDLDFIFGIFPINSWQLYLMLFFKHQCAFLFLFFVLSNSWADCEEILQPKVQLPSFFDLS